MAKLKCVISKGTSLSVAAIMVYAMTAFAQSPKESCGHPSVIPLTGYAVTMVKDSTADYSHEEMHAALDINIPNYANAIVTTEEAVVSIVSL